MDAKLSATATVLALLAVVSVLGLEVSAQAVALVAVLALVAVILLAVAVVRRAVLLEADRRAGLTEARQAAREAHQALVAMEQARWEAMAAAKAKDKA